MLHNYLKIAIRNMTKHKVYSIINILGLTIGIVCVMLIVLFIEDEYSYDKFNKKGDRIYRVAIEYSRPNGSMFGTPITPWRLKPALETYFPDIKEVTRLGMPTEFMLKYKEQSYSEDRICFADKNFDDVFSIKYLLGNPNEALAAPYTMVLTQSVAEKYFGDENPLGKTIRAMTHFGDFEFEITGVIEDIPQNAHFDFEILISTKTGEAVFSKVNTKILENWGEGSVYTYLLLPEKYKAGAIEQQFDAFMNKTIREKYSEHANMFLQPLFDIHLKSQLRGEFKQNGDINYVYIFGIIALFILIIAAINYMNLATARSVRRAREVGIRKVVGATRQQIIVQFLGEAVILTLISMIIALVIVELSLPFFNQLSGKELSINFSQHFTIFLLFLVFALLTGILAGSYPSFFLSAYRPIDVLKKDVSVKSANSAFRKVLVVIQLTISIALIIATLVILRQWNFIQSKKLGINSENVVIIPLPYNHYQTYKDLIKQNPDVVSVTASNKKLTGRLSSNLDYKAEGMPPDKPTSIKIVTVDYDFFETLHNKIVKGRSFSKEYPTDATKAFILNETAVKEIGWTEPVGKWFQTSTLDKNLQWKDRKGTVIGVAEDFHFESLHNKIEAVVFFIEPNWLNWVSIRIKNRNTTETLSFLKEKWETLVEKQEFAYSFLDKEIDSLYRNEKRFLKIFFIFSLLAIFIASLGILGLVSYTAEQRTKEIGIRKTYGATKTQIWLLLTKSFLILLMVAYFIAAPLAYLYINDWLSGFSYHISLTFVPALWAFIIAVGISLFTISYQALKAAAQNPAATLNYE